MVVIWIRHFTVYAPRENQRPKDREGGEGIMWPESEIKSINL